jgi:hypothetical protein
MMQKNGTSGMPSAIISNPVDVRNELIALGLDFDGLVDCVRYAERERSFVTVNDAIGWASLVVYDKAGRALREKYEGPEWTKDDSSNQCAIKNASKKIRVVPCNFDENAGNPLVRPTNKSPKGEVSRKKSICNMTAWIPGLPDTAMGSDDGFQTWLLGMFMEDEEQTTAELSLPIAFDGYYFTDFGKRIMLIMRDGSGGIARKSGDGSGNDAVEIVDIPVRHK